ncbi:unnamed protein product [Medioppia subpectinata]|uniref:Cytochrome P450 n=1 Tax=Medioppia subpectinata TaxID=1979941 RepID=A0A7R9QFP4_9ACAR|nr:unnamed protein product [Medioppia subpectinata]CAG2119242.1 unnamed protein product [Medioppia subpectinata]
MVSVYQMQGKPSLMVADPELIKQILVKDFYKFRNRRPVPGRRGPFKNIMFSARDDDWKRIRAIASPIFTSGKLKHMYPLINECCRDFLAALDRDVSTGGTEVELRQLMGYYSMDVIASTAFATKTNPYSDPNNRFITTANGIFNQNPWKILLSTILPTFVINSRVYKSVMNVRTPDVMFFIDVIRSLIAERKKSGKKYNDFLQLLMDVERVDTTTGAADASDAAEAHHLIEGVDELKAEKQALSDVSEKRLTTDEILAQCFLFFVGGFETTATTLSYCVYELALNPDIQDRLVKETKEAFNENTADIDYETLCRLPLLDAVISETLRHYTPFVRLEREAMEDVVLTAGSDGFQLKIEKGILTQIPVYAIHHDPDYFPDPFAFKPERFLPENRHNIKPYTYLPFGSGPRNCIGMRFALLEVKLALVQMIQQFRVYRVPNTDVPVIFNKARDNLQAKRLVVGVSKR